MAAASFLSRLDARDQALFARCLVRPGTPSVVRRVWTTLTHLGGARASVAASVVPAAAGIVSVMAAVKVLATLALSHVVVQLLKRTVGRPRPAASGHTAIALAPDAFSFPSGHSAAAMAVAIAYAALFPHIALPLVVLALAVGLSRVCLGVHYPGDVVTGQLIAVATAVAVFARW